MDKIMEDLKELYNTEISDNPFIINNPVILATYNKEHV